MPISKNIGLNEASGFMSDTSGKIVTPEIVKQLSATLLNSVSQGQTSQRQCSATWLVKNFVNSADDNIVKTTKPHFFLVLEQH